MKHKSKESERYLTEEIWCEIQDKLKNRYTIGQIEKNTDLTWELIYRTLHCRDIDPSVLEYDDT